MVRLIHSFDQNILSFENVSDISDSKPYAKIWLDTGFFRYLLTVHFISRKVSLRN